MLKDELEWARMLAEAGCFWFRPIANADGVDIDDEGMIERDLEIIARMDPSRDMLLLRPGWTYSEGAKREWQFAMERGIRAITQVDRI